jgi:hypothetical protein
MSDCSTYPTTPRMRSTPLRMASLIATCVLLATTLGRPVVATAGDPLTPQGDPEPPIPIFLNAPTDLDAFWKMLSRPDFVILDGDLYRKLRLASEVSKLSGAANPAVVGSIEVTGTVSEDWASLAVEYRVTMATEGPNWVPIFLDGLTISEVREASVDLPTRIVEGRGWQVELKGQGEHVVRVTLLAPVRSTVEGRRLELAIPPASSTRIDLVIPQKVLDASSGVNEPVGMVPVADGQGVRLSARLSPRSRLDLAWRERVEPAIKLPTLLSAQGEISLEIERGSIRSRSSWVLGSIRGTTSQITLRLDSAEELLDIEVDNKPIQFETRREGARSVVSILLPEPLRPNTTRTLLLNTRRPIASSGTARVAFQGYSFDQAKVQTGVVAIARTGPIFINPTPGRGLRRIDPRTELPESLRSRPDTTLAFEFNDQPFDLGLGIEPAPPRLRVEERTTVTLAAQSARLHTRLDCQTSQGRVFEVKVVLPRGLEFEGAEPAEVVESAQVVPLDPEAALTPGVGVPRIATITLTPQARESDSFSIVLKGWAAIDPSKLVALPIFQPKVDAIDGARFAIVADRNVTVDLAGFGDEPPPFRIDWGQPPADWAWPSRKPSPDSGLLWLRCDADPKTIPLKVTVRPRSIRHESTLSASIDRKGAEVVEEISVEVAYGVAAKLDISLPPEVPSRWEVEGVELVGRDPLGPDTSGNRRYRLLFARDYADNFRFRVRYRLPFAEPLQGEREAKLRFEPIRVLEGSAKGRRLVVSAEPRFELRSDARGWETSTIPDPSMSPESGPTIRLALSSGEERAAPVEVFVRAGHRLPMPDVVVSRLWIRTELRSDGDLATTARLWVEARDGSLGVGLPPGSRWIRVRAGGSELPEGSVEHLASDEYRLGLPTPNSSGPVLVAIDFVVPSTSTSGGWPTLRLLGNGVVQRTMWEAQVPASRAGIGTPAGWTDENEWFWAGGLWKRQPHKNSVEVWHWLTGGGTRPRLNEMIETGEPSAFQSYLFSRVGPPTTLRFFVFSRIGLLFLCSGPLLAIGLLVLARRPPPRLIAASLLILAFAAGVLIEPDVLILVLQSSILGVALWLSALAMHWAMEKAGHSRGAGEGALIVSPSSTASSMVYPPSPGSDDSTAIRTRPVSPSAVSTADHLVLFRTPGLQSDEFSHEEPDAR